MSWFRRKPKKYNPNTPVPVPQDQPFNKEPNCHIVR